MIKMKKAHKIQAINGIAMRKDMVFFHKHYLTEDKKSSLKCKITKIEQGVVYYRPIYFENGNQTLGKANYIEIEKFPTIAIY